MRSIKQVCYTILFILIFGFPNHAIAQFDFYQELGIIAGPSFLRSDFGQRHNNKSNLQNSGIGIGLVHYMNFAYVGYSNNGFTDYLREHVKVRSELSYMNAKLEHNGAYIQNPIPGNDAYQLKNMRGETNLYNLGMSGEYSFIPIHEYEDNDMSFSPFVGLGAQLHYYDPHISSKIGDINDPEILFPKFIGGISNEPDFTWSVGGNIGTRFKIGVLDDLILDLRGQYFFSDWVDGLKPNPDIYKENKHNDLLVWLNIGYIHYLGD